ncbi:biliverdin-producing heme oxygenase [Azorhizobium doebereinerae]|uniref:biliverdin-producing heme oxygenase n=1 Tax=Azorhizobium doebereinerae TaxID=281091 RepID=UPI000686A2C1|nr:biliverdin-producing heme oxygenase [Azorhizobium doebereinerae]
MGFHSGHQSHRFVLRAGTMEQHLALEAAVGPLNSLPAYTRYLRGLQAFRTPLERQLAAVAIPPALSPVRPIPLAELVVQDRADLGDHVPVWEETASLSLSPSALFGVFYVLEGSTLGARLLHKQAGQLGLGAAHGARHLAEQISSPETWKQFVGVLDAADDLNMDEAVVAANAVFGAAERALARQDDAEYSNRGPDEL